MMRLQGRTALVTGSSSGIGGAIATRFAYEGADLVINGRDEKKIAEVVKEIEAIGRRALGIPANVGSFAESKAMIERAVAEFGHLDILVCNAGVFHHWKGVLSWPPPFGASGNDPIAPPLEGVLTAVQCLEGPSISEFEYRVRITRDCGGKESSGSMCIHNRETAQRFARELLQYTGRFTIGEIGDLEIDL